MARLSVTGSLGVFIIVPVAEKDEILRTLDAAGVVPADEMGISCSAPGTRQAAVWRRYQRALPCLGSESGGRAALP